MDTKLKKADRFLVGFIIGIIAPIIVFIIYYKMYYDFIRIDSFIFDVMVKNIFAPLLSLCAVINLGIFYFFYWKFLNYAARGVVGATFIYAFIVIIIKLL